MIAVTQASKGIDNKVVSNCTTQFLGKQNSPTDQQSVKAMIAAAGGAADDVGKLAAGEFYFKTKKSGKPFKARNPISLSYHPPNSPTPKEVVAKARFSYGVLLLEEVVNIAVEKPRAKADWGAATRGWAIRQRARKERASAAAR